MIKTFEIERSILSVNIDMIRLQYAFKFSSNIIKVDDNHEWDVWF